MFENRSVNGTRQRDPMIIKDLLGGILKELAPTVRGDAVESLDRLGLLWKEVVGDDFAALSRVVRYRGGVLTVEVRSAPLRAELAGFARSHLLEELAARGLEGIHDLDFRIGSTRSGLKEGWGD